MKPYPCKAFVLLLASLTALSASSASALAAFMPPQSQILSDMVLANDYFTNEWPTPGCNSCLPGNHPSNIWTRGTYFEGALALYRINHDPAIYAYATNWGTFHNWTLRYADTTDFDANDQCAGQDYIELYQMDPTQTQRLTHITNNVNAWIARTNVDYWDWVDALQMSMPVFAKMTALFGNTDYSAKMYAYFHYTKSVIGPANGLYSLTDHLWYRDTNFLSNYIASDGTPEKCYWSRGNGWAFVALARTMEVLPTNDTHFAEYLQTFQQMAAALKAVQRADGFWNVNLAYPNDYPGPETSGTACFTYGFAWGIHHGYLDAKTYLPAVIKGWNALAIGALHHSTGSDNGFLGYVQGTGDQPSSSQPVTYNRAPNFDDFALGLFLLAGSQVYELSSVPGITLTTPVVTNNQVQLNFSIFSSATNGTFYLLESPQLSTSWTTNLTAELTTNITGISYRFSVTNNASTKFYRVQFGS